MVVSRAYKDELVVRSQSLWNASGEGAYEYEFEVEDQSKQQAPLVMTTQRHEQRSVAHMSQGMLVVSSAETRPVQRADSRQISRRDRSRETRRGSGVCEQSGAISCVQASQLRCL